MSDRIRVCTEDELKDGERKIISEGGVEIGVFNVDGEYHALLNNCGHQNGPICKGAVARDIDGEIREAGQRVKETYSDDHIVICPWHGWAYEIETGEHAGDEDLSIPTFDVTVDGEIIYVET